MSEREQKTLYVADLADPQKRAAQPSKDRGRRAKRAERTSDVTRFQGVWAASCVGALTIVGIAAFDALGETSIRSGGGQLLSLPHQEAKLTCASCHKDHPPASPKGRKAATSACGSCHGDHPTTRAGHRKMFEAGEMTCTTCHRVHRSMGGVRFREADDDEPNRATRFAIGSEVVVEDITFRTDREITVFVPTKDSCSKCHDARQPADPIRRCLVQGLGDLGNAEPTLCFDEHQQALPPDAIDVRGQPSLRGRTDRNAKRGGRRADRDQGDAVCAEQHYPDRPLAWEAAREAVVSVPNASGAASGGFGGWWLGAGASTALLTLALHRLAGAIRRRTRKPAEPATTLVRERVRLPTIDTNTCLGCYACVDACPYDVLEIQKYVAVVVRPDACCGLTLCEQRCPNGSLQITDGEPIELRPRLRRSLESEDVPGLFLAGDVTGVPLIKNSIAQGAEAMDAIHASLETTAETSMCDVLIIGGGPAGISAALRAKELSLTATVIEQGDVAQSIRSFPRGKLVFDQPLELPVRGKLWLKESTKEELLTHWLRIVRKEALDIRADTRMTGVHPRPSGGFDVTTVPREGEGQPSVWQARRVLVCIGQRGTPRRLPVPVPSELESVVHYSLADARSFDGKQIVVVGLGDVAMETAIALARQANTRVTVVHRGDDFTRGKSRNIDEVRRMSEAGRLVLRLSSRIVAVRPEGLQISGPSGEAILPFDALFVMIGNIPPWNTLKELGIQTVGGTKTDGEQILSAPRP